MIQKKWFSVEHLKDGSIGKVVEVEAKGRSGAVVRFYEAGDAADACSQALAWYARYAEKARDSAREKLRAKRADGLCTGSGCRRQPRDGKSMCRECLEKTSKRSAAIKRRRRAGDSSNLRLHPGGPEGVMNRRIQNSRARHDSIKSLPGGRTANRYRQILDKFDGLGPVAFRVWLVSKIPAMQQTQGEWHPPMAYEPMAQAAE